MGSQIGIDLCEQCAKPSPRPQSLPKRYEGRDKQREVDPIPDHLRCPYRFNRPIPRREFLIQAGLGALGIVAAGCSGGGNGRRPQDEKPNILFILADDLGYGDLGCYGQDLIQTPNLDRMAAEGVRFTQFYAGSTICAPSRGCLLTGLHTGHASVRENQGVSLRPEDVTVAEMLKEAGYRTGAIGKWGLGKPGSTGLPNRQGFDEWFGYLDQRRAHNYYPDYLWRNEEIIPLEENQGGQKGLYSHDLFTAEALDYIRRHRKHPFFLYLAYTIPHTNTERGQETGNGMEVPTDAPYSDENWPQPQKNYAAMITRMDRDIGRIIHLLKKAGIDQNTVVFFSSDNGPNNVGGIDPGFFQSSGPLRGIKRDLYEGGIRVPWIVRWPGRIPEGMVSDHVGAFWDFPSTAAALAGAPAPTLTDGISLLPSLLGQPQRNHDYLYWEYHGREFSQAVRWGDWKGIRLNSGLPLELYDLRADPGEQHDVADHHPDVVADIEALLQEARTEPEQGP